MTAHVHGEVRHLDGPGHVGLYSEPDPVMGRRHLVAEVIFDPGVFDSETPWVVEVTGVPVCAMPTRGEAIHAAWEFVEQSDEAAADAYAADYDGQLDAAIRNGVR